MTSDDKITTKRLKPLITNPLCGEATGDQWIPHKIPHMKGQ